MTKSTDREARRLEANDAQDLLARAAELDASAGSSATVGELRRAAIEAGISPGAFEEALTISGLPESSEVPAQGLRRSPQERVPRWVRICLFGVPDRSAAMTFYWLFIAALFASPVLAFTGVLGPISTVGSALFLLFASWSTSQAVKWADEHGWNASR